MIDARAFDRDLTAQLWEEPRLPARIASVRRTHFFCRRLSAAYWHDPDGVFSFSRVRVP
jgi:hypothetical protein